MLNLSRLSTFLFFFSVVAAIRCGMSVAHGRMRQVLPLALNSVGVSRGILFKASLEFNIFKLEIPMNEYYEYFGPDFELDVRSSNMNDLNTREYLDRVKRIVLENLRQIGGPPGIQMTGLSGWPF